jgi:hypothetical protein
MSETATVAMPSGLAGYSMTRLALAQLSRMVVVVSTAVARQSARWFRMDYRGPVLVV